MTETKRKTLDYGRRQEELRTFLTTFYPNEGGIEGAMKHALTDLQHLSPYEGLDFDALDRYAKDLYKTEREQERIECWRKYREGV